MKRDLEDEDDEITAPWGLAYTPNEILENGNTNLNFLISYSLGGTHKKYVRNQMKGILFQAWDKYRNKLSPAEKKSLDPNDPDLMEALRDEFEDNMDEAWKESQFGGNINKMTKEAKAEMEKREPLLKKLAGETYKKELTEDYKNNLGKLETDIKREYDKGEGHIKSKYKDKIARAKSILAQARKDAEEKNIPASWVKKNVIITFDKTTGEPNTDYSFINKMIKKVGTAQQRIQKLDDDIIEIQEAVNELKGKRRGQKFSDKFYRDLNKEIETAEKHIKKHLKEQKQLNYQIRQMRGRPTKEQGEALQKKRKDLEDLEKQIRNLKQQQEKEDHPAPLKLSEKQKDKYDKEISKLKKKKKDNKLDEIIKDLKQAKKSNIKISEVDY